MNPDSKIYIAGHRGLVGSAIIRKLQSEGFTNLIYKPHNELDLTNQQSVADFFAAEKPEYVFLAAAKVGGILSNKTRKAEFICQNLQIQTNIIDSSYRNGVKKLLFLGSSCIYPKLCPQPIKEEYLLTGPLEETNDAYAIAKIAGIMMCQSYNLQYKTNYISVMPTNLYGPNDNFDLQDSHVLPALLRKFHEAKQNNEAEVTVWGTGNVYREFLHVDDLADATLFLMQNYNDSQIVNIGTGRDILIKELAGVIAQTTGYTGQIGWDTTKPDGTPRKLLDVTKLTTLGWTAKINLQEGLKQTYDWYRESHK